MVGNVPELCVRTSKASGVESGVLAICNSAVKSPVDCLSQPFLCRSFVVYRSVFFQEINRKFDPFTFSGWETCQTFSIKDKHNRGSQRCDPAEIGFVRLNADQ